MIGTRAGGEKFLACGRDDFGGFLRGKLEFGLEGHILSCHGQMEDSPPKKVHRIEINPALAPRVSKSNP